MKPIQTFLAVAVVFPVMMCGFVAGFIYESLSIGFCGGIRAVDDLGDKASKTKQEK